MPKRPSGKTVATLRHSEASRKNIPTAEFRSVMDRSEQSPVQVAYERRNRDLDPQLVWRGKDEQDWSDLVVQAPPLYIQEKVHPKVLIDDLRRRTQDRRRDREDVATETQPDLFADFNGLPDDGAKTEFYQHDANWSNRMILGDSLQVITSVPHFQDHASDNWGPEGAGSDGVVNRSWSGRRSNMLSWSTCSIW